MRFRSLHYTTVEVSVLLIVALAILASPLLPQALRFSLFMMPFSGLLIFTFAWKKGLVSKALSNKVLIFFGNISFSFYMIHQLVIRYVFSFGVQHAALISLFMSLCAACVMYVFFEEPARIKVKAYLDTKLEDAIQARRFGLSLRIPRFRKHIPTPSFIRPTPELNE